MTKKKDIANDLVRGRSLKKKLSITDSDAAEVVNKVVEQAIEVPKKVEKEVIRTTMDLPKYIHKAIKVKAAQEEMGLKEYIVSLVKKDLNLE